MKHQDNILEYLEQQLIYSAKLQPSQKTRIPTDLGTDDNNKTPVLNLRTMTPAIDQLKATLEQSQLG